MRSVHAFIAISYALHNSPQIILFHTNEPFFQPVVVASSLPCKPLTKLSKFHLPTSLLAT